MTAAQARSVSRQWLGRGAACTGVGGRIGASPVMFVVYRRATNVVYYYYAVYIAHVRSDTGVLKPLSADNVRLSGFHLFCVLSDSCGGHAGGWHTASIGGRRLARAEYHRPSLSAGGRSADAPICPLGCGSHPRGGVLILILASHVPLIDILAVSRVRPRKPRPYRCISWLYLAVIFCRHTFTPILLVT